MKPFTLHHGDCLEVMRAMPDASVDAIVTDPPYHLVANKKDDPRRASPDAKQRGKGFMGQTWDGGDIAQRVELWAECLRVLKPGGHLLAFSGTRTQHRMVCAIEDAGFEIRDQIGWAYGSGFPKSRNIADHDLAGEEANRWGGWGTALKPAWEPICVARKPLAGTVAANVLAFGTGAINIDACRVHGDDAQGGSYTVMRLKPGATLNETGGKWRTEGDDAEVFHGEMKPGRWPANIIHDGSPEVVALFPESNGSGAARTLKRGTREGEGWGMADEAGELRDAGTGSAARFFYCAKASRADRNEGLPSSDAPAVTTDATMRECETADWSARNGNHHPTVKPTDLMAYLVRLVTPPGGLVLDPFMGSGSTGKACMREGFRFAGIDMTADYVAIAAARIEHEHQLAVEAAKPAPVPPQMDLFGSEAA